jgi:hypothetical protein
MAIDKICEGCGNTFRVTKDRAETAKFCSMKCKGVGKKRSAPCIVCGTEFERYTSSQHRMKYCSKACYLKGVSVPPKKKVERPTYVKQCVICGQSFQVNKFRLDIAKTCSKECANQHASLEYKKRREVRACLECGREISLPPSRYERGAGRFCSLDCRNVNEAWRKERGDSCRGEKHYKWTGDTYESSRGYIYKYVSGTHREVEHRQVALAAMLEQVPDHPFLTRDVTGKVVFMPRIEVHHIDRNRANNELHNLLVVTQYAHKWIHSNGRKPDPWECWPSNPDRW